MAVRQWQDPDALAAGEADELIAIIAAAVTARGICHVALSGGSTPKRMFGVLAQRGRAAAPYDHVAWWWGDERTVPPDHPDSNYLMAKQTLLDPLAIVPHRVHRMRGEGPDFTAAARDYEGELVRALGGPPVFDLILLGMGPDGHCASLFPGTPALAVTDQWVVANPVDSPVAKGKTVRLTLTAPAINAARHVRFAVTGADKADMVKTVLDGPRDPKRYPSQLIQPSPGDVIWDLDTGAASKLGGKP